MLPNYEQLIDKIAKSSGLPKEEIEQKVDAKCAKLSGLISKEGSAQIVASELGISFENEKFKINELLNGMRKVNVIGKVIQMFPAREFTTKNGTPGKVLNLVIADDSGNIRTVLWDTKLIELFEKGNIKHGDVIDVSNGTIRNENELHLGSYSEIKKSDEVFENVKTEKQTLEKNIDALKPGESVKLRAFVVQIFEPRFFEVCPECGKKAVDNKCNEHGNINPEKRALIGVVLDDGSDSMRAVMFSEQIKQFGFVQDDLENGEIFAKKKEELLGKEALFSCNVRNNQLFNTTELIINNTEEIDLDSLIESLK